MSLSTFKHPQKLINLKHPQNLWSIHLLLGRMGGNQDGI